MLYLLCCLLLLIREIFSKDFYKNSNLEDSVILLPDFPSRTNLELQNISVNPTVVKKEIMNLDLFELYKITSNS